MIILFDSLRFVYNNVIINHFFVICFQYVIWYSISWVYVVQSTEEKAINQLCMFKNLYGQYLSS